MDADGDGAVSLDEFRSICRGDIPMLDDELKEFMEGVVSDWSDFWPTSALGRCSFMSLL